MMLIDVTNRGDNDARGGCGVVRPFRIQHSRLKETHHLYALIAATSCCRFE